MNDLEFKGLVLVLAVIILGSGGLLAYIGWHKWKRPEFVRLIEWKDSVRQEEPEFYTQLEAYDYLLRSSLRPVKSIGDWPQWEDYHVPETYTRYRDGQLI